jgi:hypothetical protein
MLDIFALKGRKNPSPGQGDVSSTSVADALGGYFPSRAAEF